MLTFLFLLALVLPAIALLAAPYCLAIFMGALLALMSQPLDRRLRRLGAPPAWSALLVTVGGLVLIIAPLTAFLTLAAKQAIAVAQQAAASEDLSFRSLLERLGAFGPLRSLLGDPAEVERQLRGQMGEAARTATGLVLKTTAKVPLILVQLAMACLAWYFLVRDGRRLISWAMGKLPLDDDVRERILQSFTNTALSTVWATLAAAAAQALAMSAAFLALGIPSVLLASGSTFILAWIPVVGSVPVSLGAMLYLYSEGLYVRVGLMAGLGFLVTLVDNVVRPWVLEGREDMHPFVSLVAIIAGIGMFGLPGAFLGPILVSLGISLLDLWPLVAERYGFSTPEEKS